MEYYEPFSKIFFSEHDKKSICSMLMNISHTKYFTFIQYMLDKKNYKKKNKHDKLSARTRLAEYKKYTLWWKYEIDFI